MRALTRRPLNSRDRNLRKRHQIICARSFSTFCTVSAPAMYTFRGSIDTPCNRCVRFVAGVTDGSRPSRPREFHPEPLTGRVGDWRAGLGRSLCSPLTRSFVCECHIISTMPRFQPPPRRTQRAIFWHYALLFASPQSLWDLSCRGSFPRRPVDPVAVEQPQGCIQPLPTPPRPAEAPAIPGTHHMAPDLLFYPVLNERKALAGVS